MNTSTGQGQAVRTFVAAVLQSKGITFNEGQDVKAHYDIFKEEVKAMLFKGFKDETIQMKSESKQKYLTQYGGTDSALKIYVSGLLNNWVRKDKSLNGGVKHEIKNPGSRSGSSDATVKSLKGLLQTNLKPEVRQQVQAALEQRLAEIKPTKAAPQIDMDVLPEHIKALITG